MRYLAYAAAAVLLTSCSTSATMIENSEVSAAPVGAAHQCVPLQTKATFSCWWSGPDSPLSHCVLRSEDEPACGMKAKGGAYLTRGASVRETTRPRPEGTWMLVSVYEDHDGKVGQRAERSDGTVLLDQHWESPVPTGPLKEPIFPRWPEGVEFGPEQTAQK